MTNSWTDIGNATFVLAIGANPAENHPACMNHINNARKGPHTWYDPAGNARVTNKRAAKFIVVDPRYTRTAAQADMYVRIRPGTDTAFINGIIRYIMANASGNFLTNWAEYLNDSSAAAMIDNTQTAAAAQAGLGKWTDARFKVKADDSDYVRSNQTFGARTFNDLPERAASYDASSDTVYKRLEAHVAAYDEATVSDICGCSPGQLVAVAQAFMDNCAMAQSPAAQTVAWANPAVPQAIMTPVPANAPFGYAMPTGVVSVVDAADPSIVYALTTDYTFDAPTQTVTVVAGRITNPATITWKWGTTTSGTAPCGQVADPTHADFRAATMLYAMGITQHTYGSQSIKSFANLQTLLGNMGRSGGGINALRGIHNVQGSTDMGLLYHLIPGYSGPPKVKDSYPSYIDSLYGNRPYDPAAAWPAKASLTIGAAGESQVKFTALAYGTLSNAITVEFVNAGASQTLAVTVGGAGWDAISVRLATDAGGVITSTAAQVVSAVNKAARAKDLVKASYTGTAGSGLVAVAAAAPLAGGVDPGTDNAHLWGSLGIQQRGFHNMHKKWFMGAMADNQANRASSFALWPRANGDDHITMFRKMAAGTITAAIVWGQNPAVTEPHQSAVRDGLATVPLLVCVDEFATETVMCDRSGAGAETYFIPACSYVEEPGSVTNSARTLQWREQATQPKGNSRTDIELLLRFAYALYDNGGFDHIEAVTGGNAWTDLYSGYLCGFAPTFWAKGAAPTLGVWKNFNTTPSLSGEIWKAKDSAPTLGQTLKGAEAVCEKIFREMAAGNSGGAAQIDGLGTIWLYKFAFNCTDVAGTAPADLAPGHGAGWAIQNRAKSRNNSDADSRGGGHRMFKNWGFTWLDNRRVLYNNGVAWDVSDGFQGPDAVSRLFVSTNTQVTAYSNRYRTIHTMADKPDSVGDVNSPHVAAGRFPGHTEPYETTRRDLVEGTGGKKKWGRNTKGTGKWDLVQATTPVYAPDDVAGSRTATVPAAITALKPTYPTIDQPLILTSIRCVEHFQGGPITRNNSWNVEAEPVPWVEINSADARARGINDGDWVDVITVRSNSTTDQVAHQPGGTYTRNATNPADNFGLGFKARVGVGLAANQRVGQGMVAIPWHWGDQGLSTGARANDLCIDAGDANTVIPEYKACVCWIKKA